MSVCITALVFFLPSIFLPGADSDKINFLSRNQTLIPFFTLLFGSLLGLWDDLMQIYGTGSFAKDGASWRIWKALLVGIISLLIGMWFFYKLGIDSVHIPFGHE